MRGGYRPGSGPQKGAKYKPRTPKQDMKATPKAEAKPKRKKTVRADPAQPLPEKSAPVLSPEDAKQAALEKLTPLEYLLREMNDATVDKNRRDKLAGMAAPFVHPRAGEGKGKKEEKESRAKAAAGGRFSASPAPLKVIK